MTTWRQQRRGSLCGCVSKHRRPVYTSNPATIRTDQHCVKNVTPHRIIDWGVIDKRQWSEVHSHRDQMGGINREGGLNVVRSTSSRDRHPHCFDPAYVHWSMHWSPWRMWWWISFTNQLSLQRFTTCTILFIYLFCLFRDECRCLASPNAHLTLSIVGWVCWWIWFHFAIYE